MPRRRSRYCFSFFAAFLLLLASLPSRSDSLLQPASTPNTSTFNTSTFNTSTFNTSTFQTASITPEAERASFIAIIIDDIGNNRYRGELAIEIPGQLTYAIIPETTHATPLARYAHASGKEVMVHLPMENTHNQPLGKLALTRSLSETDYDAVLSRAVEHVPHAKGLNNHMGSALTQEPQAMAWLMRAVKRHQLFFVDSRTTHKTVARDMADRANIMAASRDVFLDNDRTLYAIDQQFQRLVALARQKKTAIAIGHPYMQTIDYLERAIPQLQEEGIYLLSVSSIMKLRLADRQIASTAMGAE